MANYRNHPLVFAAGVALGVAISIGVTVGLTAATLHSGQNRLSLSSSWPLLAAIPLVMGLVAGLLAYLWAGQHGAKLRRRHAELTAVLGANTALRLKSNDPIDLLINALADQRDEARDNLQSHVVEARRQLAAERSRLAALIGELRVGVLLCTGQGQIALSNHAARTQLGAKAGLGRSVLDFLDSDLLNQDTATVQIDGRTFDLDITRTFDPAGVSDAHIIVLRSHEPVRVIPLAPDQPRPEFWDFDFLDRHRADFNLRELPLHELNFTVFDTETTGLNPDDGDEIISIAAVRVVNGRVRAEETFATHVNPRRRIPASSTAIHHITDADVADAPLIGEALADFAEFAKDSVLVGHNVSFDLKFFRHKAASTGILLSQAVLDTLLLDAAAFPDHESHSLEAICERLGVEVVDRHSALGDAVTTAEVLSRLLTVLRDRGVTTLAEAEDASESTFLARRNHAMYDA